MRVDDSTACVHLLVITRVRNIIRLWKYIDFARAKSEALDSLLQQNIKSCNAKRRRHRDRWKNNNRSNEQKSNLERASRFFCTFLCPCFARLQRESSRNVLVTRFIKEMSYVFLFLFFFSLRLIFTLVAASISLFLTAATNFSCCPSNKEWPSFFCRSFSRWASLACRLFSLFLCLSLSLYSKFVDMIINLSLIL